MLYRVDTYARAYIACKRYNTRTRIAFNNTVNIENTNILQHVFHVPTCLFRPEIQCTRSVYTNIMPDAVPIDSYDAVVVVRLFILLLFRDRAKSRAGENDRENDEKTKSVPKRDSLRAFTIRPAFQFKTFVSQVDIRYRKFFLKFWTYDANRRRF